MNPLQVMELNKPYFTQNDMMIYETILQNPSFVTHMTTSTLAERCGVSQPALSRFIKVLGYSRYQDFRAAMTVWLAQKSNADAQGTNHLAYFNDLYLLLQKAEQLMTVDYMHQIAEYICGFDHIFTSGVGKSFHSAQLLEILMRKTRRYVHAVSHDALNELTDFMSENDLLVLFSVSARASIMDEAVKTDHKILLVTANPQHRYQEQVDRTVVLPYVSSDFESCSVSPVLFDIFVELLVQYVAQVTAV